MLLVLEDNLSSTQYKHVVGACWGASNEYQQHMFLYPPHDSGGVLWFDAGSPCVCLSTRQSYVCTSVFRFRMITWVNINGFSPNLLWALILWRSGVGLLMDEFCQIFTELSARDTIIVGYHSLMSLFYGELRKIIPELSSDTPPQVLCICKTKNANKCYWDFTKTRLFKFTENFPTKKWKFLGKKFWYFSYFCSKHRLWVLVRTASTRQF